MLLARLRGDAGVMRHREGKRASSGADACTAVPASGDVGKHLMGEPAAAWERKRCVGCEHISGGGASAGCERKSSGGDGCT
jgi:hypothetical protein